MTNNYKILSLNAPLLSVNNVQHFIFTDTPLNTTTDQYLVPWLENNYNVLQRNAYEIIIARAINNNPLKGVVTQHILR